MATILIKAIVTSHLDCSNSLPSGCLAFSFDSFLTVLKVATAIFKKYVSKNVKRKDEN